MKGAILVSLVLVAAPAVAQTPPSPSSPGASAVSLDMMRMRYQIRVMERVLEQAVQHGAQVVAQQVQSITPNMLLFAGPARARGFELEGYGVFFDVEVPAIRRSVAWSMLTLNQLDLGVNNALAALRQHVESVRDAPSRSALEVALRRLEMQVGPARSVPVVGARAAVVDDDPDARASGARPVPAPAVMNPREVYAGEITRQLIDVMLNHSSSLRIGSDDWLTVAARDNEGRLVPTELSDAVTVTLRIRGRDLAAFRAGGVSRDEARKRVEVREF